MDLEIIMLSNSNRERQISYDVTYMCNPKNNMNEIIMRLTEIENKLMFTKGEGIRDE